MLAVSNASVTKIVDGLVQKGLLSRTAHPTDRRAQVLAPTDQAAVRYQLVRTSRARTTGS